MGRDGCGGRYTIEVSVRHADNPDGRPLIVAQLPPIVIEPDTDLDVRAVPVPLQRGER